MTTIVIPGLWYSETQRANRQRQKLHLKPYADAQPAHPEERRMVDRSWQRLNTNQKLEWLLNEVFRNASHTIDLNIRMDDGFAAADVRLKMIADDLEVLKSEVEVVA
jgi:hypothetical protein